MGSLFGKVWAQRFTPKLDLFWFLVSQKIHQDYRVNHQHKSIKVNILHSPANFNEGILSKNWANCLKIVFKYKWMFY